MYRKAIPATLKTYLIPLAIISLSFILAGYFIISTINSFLFQHMINDSIREANNHISRLSNSILATDKIEELLNEKLTTANNVLLNNQDRISDQFLKEMLANLKVDEIYWYNSEGTVIYTANDFLGWQTWKGHMTHTFLHSEDDYFIEPIRLDQDSGVYLKYAYAKADNGGFVQTGILAKSIYATTEDFCPQKFVELLVDKENIIEAIYLNNDTKLSYCEANLINASNYNLSANEKSAIEENKTYFAKTQLGPVQVYETLFPIFVNGEKMGTLIIFYSLDSINTLTRTVSFIAFILLLFIFVVYGIMVIIIGRKDYEIKNLAYYDPITKLPNKSHFKLFLDEHRKNIYKNNEAILIVNFANLNLVKLIFGYDAVDNLLVEKTQSLKELNIKEDHLYRYSEDSFFVYIENYTDEEYLMNECDKILAALDNFPYSIDANKLVIKRIGILKIDKKYKKTPDIIKYAEITINKLQKSREDSYWFFNETIQEELILDDIIEKELRNATYQGYNEEFYLEYQPQLDLKTNKIVGLEALARWNNAELGVISPLKFIDIAEKSQLIIPLGDWIINTACVFKKELESRGIEGIRLAINISVIQLLQDDFIDKLTKVITGTKIKPEHLALEITETNFINNYAIINQKLDTLRELGINIYLDDFGTGYSSLARLHNLNIDSIKIDKVFVDNIIAPYQEDILIKSIILLSHQLNLQVIAEGVETLEQKAYLIEENCDIMQGYLFSKPLSENKVIKFIEETNY